MSVRTALKQAFSRLFPARSRKAERTEIMQAFSRRYASFKELLQANADLAAVLAALGTARRGGQSMELAEVRTQARKAVVLCEQMVAALNAMSGRSYGELSRILAGLAARLEPELEQQERGDVTSLVLPLTEVDADMAYCVGNKSANLGEVGNMLEMPVPRGFAVTIQAGTLFLLRNGDLFRHVYRELRSIDADAPASMRTAARHIEERIMAAEVPQDVAEALLSAWDETFGKDSRTVAALRSSGAAEDGLHSFAGQYRTVLGVGRASLLTAFKEVLAGFFSENALTYATAHGHAVEAAGLAMCCLEMVQARAAGVAFSRHPVDMQSDAVVINGLWGLGEAVVDGRATPDKWQVDRSTGRITQKRIACKEEQLILSQDGQDGPLGAQRLCGQAENAGAQWRPQWCAVPQAQQNAPCLSDAQVQELARMVLELERHYAYPQDVEWAVDAGGALMLLQTRPLYPDVLPDMPDSLTETRPLLHEADVAAKGVACGPVYKLNEGDDAGQVPRGAVLLLRHSSPQIMPVIGQVAAILAERGSVTGHMASICREAGVPTLLNLPGAWQKLAEGQCVTVDALKGRVFAGEIPALLAFGRQVALPVADTPALALLQRIAPFILPLHLTDPRDASFTPQNCLSVHDIMRFVHEKSYTEMFALSDSLAAGGHNLACRLQSTLPLDLYIIDLGGGLDCSGPVLRREDVRRGPLDLLLTGMLDPAVQPAGPRPVNMRGFLSVMQESIIGGNRQGGERFGDRSYAIISDRYVHFSSRVGYHYAVLDCWLGDTLSKNYIRFQFSGGAAGSVQRERRVRCIGKILTELDFRVEIRGDCVRASYKKYAREEMIPRLQQLGRLLMVTRQMDMLMVNDDCIRIYAEKFLRGEYI